MIDVLFSNCEFLSKTYYVLFLCIIIKGLTFLSIGLNSQIAESYLELNRKSIWWWWRKKVLIPPKKEIEEKVCIMTSYQGF